MDESVEATKTALSSVIKRVVVSDKVLRRPPLRFIFNVCSEIGESTHISLNAFPTTKEDKCEWIDGLIMAVSFISGIPLKHIVPLKVAAGKEVKNTLELLRTVADTFAKWPENWPQIIHRIKMTKTLRRIQTRKSDIKLSNAKLAVKPVVKVVKVHTPKSKAQIHLNWKQDKKIRLCLSRFHLDTKCHPVSNLLKTDSEKHSVLILKHIVELAKLERGNHLNITHVYIFPRSGKGELKALGLPRVLLERSWVPALTVLNLVGLHLTCSVFPAKADLPMNLKVLDLSKNILDDLPMCFRQCISIVELRLCHNKIKDLSCDGLSGLKRLFINNNFLTKLPELSIKEMHCENNPILLIDTVLNMEMAFENRTELTPPKMLGAESLPGRQLETDTNVEDLDIDFKNALNIETTLRNRKAVKESPNGELVLEIETETNHISGMSTNTEVLEIDFKNALSLETTLRNTKAVKESPKEKLLLNENTTCKDGIEEQKTDGSHEVKNGNIVDGYIRGNNGDSCILDLRYSNSSKELKKFLCHQNVDSVFVSPDQLEIKLDWEGCTRSIDASPVLKILLSWPSLHSIFVTAPTTVIRHSDMTISLKKNLSDVKLSQKFARIRDILSIGFHVINYSESLHSEILKFLVVAK